MEKRDYLKEQIEQLGRVLGHILAGLIGQRPQDIATPTTKDILDAAGRELNLEPAFWDQPAEQIIRQLEERYHLSEEHLETLGDICRELASTPASLSEESETTLLKKSLTFYETANRKSRNFSLSRDEKIREMNNRLGGSV